MTDPAGGDPLLSVRDLAVHFPVTRGVILRRHVGTVRAVDGVSFDIAPGECLGLVGESGSGKSTTARAILQLVPPTRGSVVFDGRELVGLPAREIRELRREVQMVFQDPFASLNPRMTVGSIVGEPLRNYGVGSRKEIRARVAELLERVGLDPGFASRYPHEFSGGQRQRVGLARALALEPSLIICDEPVSALDVSIQAQIINLMMDLQADLGLAYLFIAHDLAVVRHISDRVAVMYLGEIVEVTDADTIYEAPRHPYTKALLSSVPIPDPAIERERVGVALEGEIPSSDEEFEGCPFYGRCPVREDRCQEAPPELVEVEPGHRVSCFVAADEAEGPAPSEPDAPVPPGTGSP